MMAYLQGTRHEGFLDWLLKNKYHAGADGGHYVYHEAFKKMDGDHSHTMQEDELHIAVQAWMDDGSPGTLQAACRAQNSAVCGDSPVGRGTGCSKPVPKKVERVLSDKEKAAFAFKIPGPPGVVLPPPPQKKRTAYGGKPHEVKVMRGGEQVRTLLACLGPARADRRCPVVAGAVHPVWGHTVLQDQLRKRGLQQGQGVALGPGEARPAAIL
jgi:hypothetical protein